MPNLLHNVMVKVAELPTKVERDLIEHGAANHLLVRRT